MNISYYTSCQRIRLARILSVFLMTGWGCSFASDGTVIGNLAEQMQPGTWAELKTVNSKVFDGSNSIFEYTNEMVWDSVDKKALFIGTSDPHKSDSDGKFIEYRASDNTWYQNPDPPFMPSPPVVMHAYQHHAIDPANRKLYYRRYGTNTRNFYEYDLQTRAWTEKASLPGAFYQTSAASSCYFKERGTVIHHNSRTNGVRRLHEYTPGPGAFGGKWKDLGVALTPVAQIHAVTVCNPVHGVVWFGGGDGTTQMWKLAADGTVTKLAPTPSGVSTLRTGQKSGAITTVDPASGDYLVLTADKRFWKYNITTDIWIELPGGNNVPVFVNPPDGRDATVHLVATPLKNYGVVMFAQWQWGENKVWLYKHATGDSLSPSSATGVNAQ